MYGNKVKHYQKEALKTRLASADPHQIILMLMEGAIESMKIAIITMEQRDFENKAKAISKAGSIIDSLRLSLDMDIGGELSENLASLYFYMSRRLVEANVENDPQIVAEVIDLITTIKSAWEQIPESAKNDAYQQLEQRQAV